MEHGPVLLHAGIHKTGSTWIQDVFVPSLPELAQPLTRDELAEALVFPGMGYRPDRFWDRFGGRFEEIWEDGGTAVISHEGFSGLPGRGCIGAAESVQRLALTFPRANLWVMVREQASLLRSMYSQAVKQGSRRRFGHGIIYDRPDHGSSGVVAFMDHLARWEMCTALFGDRFRMDLFERFVADKHEVLSEVLKPYGIALEAVSQAPPKNRSLSRVSFSVLRKANHFLAGPPSVEPGIMKLQGRAGLLRFLERIDQTFKLKPARHDAPWLHQWVGERFADSNQSLGHALGVDVAAYGYQTSPLAG